MSSVSLLEFHGRFRAKSSPATNRQVNVFLENRAAMFILVESRPVHFGSDMQFCPSRHWGSLASCESLEPRRLLASTAGTVAIADYHPMTAGITAHSSGLEDGVATEETTTTALDSVGGQPVTRFTTVEKSGSTTSTSHEYTSLTRDGLRLHGIDGRQGGERVRLVFETPLRFLASRVRPGDLITFTDHPLSAVMDTDAGRFETDATMTGSSRVEGFERVNLPDGRFLPAALKVTLDFTVDMVISRNDITVSAKLRVIDSTWLGRGIGEVADKGTSTSIIATDESRETSTSTRQSTLDQSSLLPP